jgi:hypothetical protein
VATLSSSSSTPSSSTLRLLLLILLLLFLLLGGRKGGQMPAPAAQHPQPFDGCIQYTTFRRPPSILTLDSLRYQISVFENAACEPGQRVSYGCFLRGDAVCQQRAHQTDTSPLWQHATDESTSMDLIDSLLHWKCLDRPARGG